MRNFWSMTCVYHYKLLHLTLKMKRLNLKFFADVCLQKVGRKMFTMCLRLQPIVSSADELSIRDKKQYGASFPKNTFACDLSMLLMSFEIWGILSKSFIWRGILVMTARHSARDLFTITYTFYMSGGILGVYSFKFLNKSVKSIK